MSDDEVGWYMVLILVFMAFDGWMIYDWIS